MSVLSESTRGLRVLLQLPADQNCLACLGHTLLSTFFGILGGEKPRRIYHVFITLDPFSRPLLILRQLSRCPYPTENKMAEACASRTHRRHQRCRPPVLKTGTDTGLLTLPFCDQSMLMRAAEGEDGSAEGAWVSAAQAPWQYTARTDEFDTARPHLIKKGLSTGIV